MGIGAQVSGALPTTRKGRVRLGAGLTTAAVALLALAVVEPWSSTTYQMEDHGVWITKANESRVGRANGEIAQIDIDLRRDSNPKIRQDGSAIYLVSGSSVTRLDERNPSGDGSVSAEVDDVADLQVGGGVAAAMDADGAVVVLSGGGAALEVGPAVMKLGDGGQIAVGPDGDLFGYSPTKGRLSHLPKGEQRASAEEIGTTQGEAQLAVIGDRAVVLDTTSGRVLGEDGTEDVPGEQGAFALQWSGPEADAALVASTKGLYRVPLGGGDVEAVVDRGAEAPLRPAFDGRCSYAAWGGESGTTDVRCGDEAAKPVDLAGGDWVWRVGGPVVALNDRQSGAAYVVRDDELVKVADWPEKDTNRQKNEQVQPPRRNPRGNEAPVAADDHDDAVLGARPGRITYLNVLRNDRDDDGDAIFVADLKDVAKGAPLEVAADRRSVRIDLGRWKVGQATSYRFRYQVSDGEHTSNWAEAEVQVRSPNENDPPEQIPRQQLTFQVEAGKQLEAEVLAAFWDPDGDPIYLAGAGRVSGDHQVTTRPDGWMTFDAALQQEQVKVPLLVKDTMNTEGEGSVDVAVGAPEVNLPPAPQSDLFLVPVGKPTTVDPLANDQDPNEDPLTLEPKIDARTGTVATLGDVRVVDGKVQITPKAKGDFVLVYAATDGGGKPVEAAMTVRAFEPSDEPPMALPDVVEVEQGDTQAVDLLLNDVDPQRRVLGITELEPPAPPKDGSRTFVKAGIESDFRTFRVVAAANAQPTSVKRPPLVYRYTVAGPNTPPVTSTVTVVVVKPRPNGGPKALPPVPVVVRPGEVARIPIERIASDPDGDPLQLTVVKASAGDARSAGDSLLYRAPSKRPKGSVAVEVSISQPAGGPIRTLVPIEVVEGTNRAPEASDIEARVRSGKTVSISVPVDGADPDGDSVRLSGITSPASRSEVKEDFATGSFLFTAPTTEVGFVDQFRYEVVDGRGKLSNEATVRVLVLPPAPAENRPVAVPDPMPIGTDSKGIWLDPTANDLDLDGDLLQVTKVPKGFETSGDCGFESEAGGLRIRLKGDEPDETCSVPYAVVDVAKRGDQTGKSTADVGTVDLSVHEDFVGLPPIANDDVAVPEGKVEEVRVDVRANDVDPDGAPKQLRAVPVDRKDIKVDEGVFVVPMTDEQQLVLYRLEDEQGLESFAYLRVPSRRQNRMPYLVESKLPIKVKAEEPKAIDLDDYIKDPDGDVLTFTATVKDGDWAVEPGSKRGDQGTYDGSRASVPKAYLQVTAVDDRTPPQTRVLSIPIAIERKNSPPKWQREPCGGTVQKGYEGAETWSLADKVQNLDDDELTFGPTGVKRQGPITVEVRGSTIVADVDDKASPGTSASFPITVSDGKAEDTRRCELVVTRYDGPVLQARPGKETLAQGKSKVVDVAGLVTNARKGLTVVPKVVSGDVRVSGATGSRFTLTATKTTEVRDAVVQYTVTDDLSEGQADRKATGQIQVDVLGPPAAPVLRQPVLGDEDFQVSWSAGVNHGQKPAEFFVKISGAGTKKSEVSCGTGSSCSIGTEALTPGGTYTFQVYAKNEIDRSEPSAAVTAPPFYLKPTDPKVTDVALRKGDPEGYNPSSSSLASFRWSVDDRGTEITSVTYQVNGGPEQPLPAAAEGSFSDAEVPNGSKACITVNMTNARGKVSAQSCSPQVAVDRPIVTGFTVVSTDTEGQVQATWTGSGNGDDDVTIKITSDLGCEVTRKGREGSANLDGCKKGKTGTFTLSATNSAGTTTFEPSPTLKLTEKPRTPSTPVSVDPAAYGIDVTLASEDLTDGEDDVDTWIICAGSTCAEVASDGGFLQLGSTWTTITKVTVEACIGGSTGTCSDIREWSGSVISAGDVPNATVSKPTWENGQVKVAWTFTPPSIVGAADFTYRIDGIDVSSGALLDGDPAGGSFELEICYSAIEGHCSFTRIDYDPQPATG